MDMKKIAKGYALLVGMALLVGCASNGGKTLPSSVVQESSMAKTGDYTYQIGPGDSVNIFVWRNPEISNTVTVRPDGKITTPLVEELQASGKTPTQLARDIEEILATYIKEPIVTVIVGDYAGPYSEQIRIVGAAANPQAIPYKEQMTALDVMIAVGGLTEFAAGNRARIVRVVDGERKEYRVRLKDLLRGGDITANVDMKPGDVLIIPESFF
ncbi:MAG: polysaccharide export protein [Pseudomonadales bacterium]|jgi:polysaccharide export outer membrane protein